MTMSARATKLLWAKPISSDSRLFVFVFFQISKQQLSGANRVVVVWAVKGVGGVDVFFFLRHH